MILGQAHCVSLPREVCGKRVLLTAEDGASAELLAELGAADVSSLDDVLDAQSEAPLDGTHESIEQFDVIFCESPARLDTICDMLDSLDASELERRTVVFGFPPGLRAVRSRLRGLSRIRALAERSPGRLRVDYYFSQKNATELVLASRSAGWLLNRRYAPRGSLKRLFEPAKRLVRGLVFLSLHHANPLCGLYAVLRQNRGSPLNREVAKTILNVLEPQRKRSLDGLDLMLQSRTTNRQVILGYAKDTKSLELVVKAAYGRTGRRSLRREKECLERLQARTEASTIVAPPALLQYSESAAIAVLATSVARGEPLYSKMGQVRSAQELEQALDGLQTLSVEMHETLRSCEARLSTIDEVYLRDCAGAASVLSQIRFDRSQHGDFAAVNLFVDERSGRWSVIDWEWSAANYPPLYDTFSLVASLGYRDGRFGAGTKYSVEDISRSLIATFCKSDVVSDAFRQMIVRVADRVGTPREQLYPAFLAYLTVCCNRYRFWYRSADYEDQYRHVLYHVLSEPSRCILHAV